MTISEYPDCPECHETLEYAFHVKRIRKTYNGKCRHLYIPVCKCVNDGCLFNYTRVLPDELTPYKHYETELIENVVDDLCTPEDIQTEDYPCEKTMDRWKVWISGNKNQIDGSLKSIGSRISVFGEELLNSEESLMDQLRNNGAGWLSIINRVMYTFRMPFLNNRQLKEVSTALSGVPASQNIGFPHQEENPHEIQDQPELAGQCRIESLQNNSEITESGP